VSEERRANRLIRCSSPYLRQHAHNPVDWYPWGEEALRRAREEDRPILLSIGYSACHWCHVMARESFEDPETARLMNEGFVNVKVDREERPDLDELYMRAVQLMTGGGGWPLTVFLTPRRVPFFGGTYFPPEDRQGRAGFPRVLRAVREAYEERRDEIAASGQQVLESMLKASQPPPAEGELGEELVAEALKVFSLQFDMEQGGFGAAPKFPQAPVLEFLLRFWGWRGDARPELMLTTTLDRMQDGGIVDQLGGGFHRYSTDRRWLVPHFEKMLYDNALLAGVYADASRAFGRAGYLETALATAGYVMEELAGPEGGFYAAQDADSEGVEGAYYAWTLAEVLDCLGEEEGRIVARYLGVSEEGNWEEGRSVLHRSISLHALAGLFGLEGAEAGRVVAEGIARLRARRRERVAPAVDDKVLTDWNGLMISALVRLHRASGEESHLAAARRCAGFLLEAAVSGDAVRHFWRQGEAGGRGFLSDYAALAVALLDLYEATFEPAYLERAGELAAAMVRDYWDEEDGIFEAAGARNEDLIAPVRSVSDQPAPSGCSLACHALLRLGSLTGEDGQARIVERVLNSLLSLMEQTPQGTAHLLSAALRSLWEPREFVLVGLEGAAAGDMLAALDEFYLPHLTRAGCEAGRAAELSVAVPLLEGKEARDGRPTAYVCSRGACREPVQEPEALRAQLREIGRQD
jgi:hypothetical protein